MLSLVNYEQVQWWRSQFKLSWLELYEINCLHFKSHFVILLFYFSHTYQTRDIWKHLQHVSKQHIRVFQTVISLLLSFTVIFTCYRTSFSQTTSSRSRHSRENIKAVAALMNKIVGNVLHWCSGLAYINILIKEFTIFSTKDSVRLVVYTLKKGSLVKKNCCI